MYASLIHPLLLLLRPAASAASATLSVRTVSRQRSHQSIWARKSPTTPALSASFLFDLHMSTSPTKSFVSINSQPRPAFALPPKPSAPLGAIARDSSTSARPISRSPSTSPPKRYIDTYIPSNTRNSSPSRYEDLRDDSHLYSRSAETYRPSRRISPYTDTYRSPAETSRSYSTSRSPEKRSSLDHYSPPASPDRGYRTLSRSRLRSRSPDGQRPVRPSDNRSRSP